MFMAHLAELDTELTVSGPMHHSLMNFNLSRFSRGVKL
jgi:hypothetical protein